MLSMRQNLRPFLVLVLLVLGAVTAGSEAPAQAQASADDTLKQAESLLVEKKFQKAVEAYQRADELAGGQCGRCQLGLAHAYTGLGQHEEAAGAARKATTVLQDLPLLSRAWNDLGVALTLQRTPDLPGAEEALRNAVKLDGPLVNTSRYNLADNLWRQKKYAEAEQLAREALNADPSGPASRSARVVLCQARTDGAPPIPPEVLYEEATCNSEPPQPADSADPAADQVIAVGKGVLPPVRLYARAPHYDEKARKKHIKGTVVLESIIDKEGCVQRLRLCKSVHPALDSAAMEAVRRWVFQPATLKGRPVKVYYTLTVNFGR